VISRVFVDSSVLIAAAMSRSGASRALFEAGSQGAVEIAISRLVIRESSQNVMRKRPASFASLQSIILGLEPAIIDPDLDLVRLANQFVVEKDAAIVAAAATFGANYLATLDKRDLLSRAAAIERAFSVAVLDPASILARLEASN
jgi:predicted nucleic acid-binding protein